MLPSNMSVFVLSGFIPCVHFYHNILNLRFCKFFWTFGEEFDPWSDCFHDASPCLPSPSTDASRKKCQLGQFSLTKSDTASTVHCWKLYGE